jgi:hypothetical protein
MFLIAPTAKAVGDATAQRIEDNLVAQGYAQYRGHYTDGTWVLATGTKDVVSRGRVVLAAGDVVLAKRPHAIPFLPTMPSGFVTIHSTRNMADHGGVATSVPRDAVTFTEG